MPRSSLAVAVLCASCILLRLAAGQAEAPALPGALAALNSSSTNITTVVLPPASPAGNESNPAAADTTSSPAPPVNVTSIQPSPEANATGSSSNASAVPVPQPWVGQLAGVNGSSNASADGSSNGTDALAEYITLRNSKGMSVVVLPLGAIIQRLIVPDK